MQLDGPLQNDASFLNSSCCLPPTVDVRCCTRSVTIIVWQPYYHVHCASTSDSAFNDVISTWLPCKVHNIVFTIGFNNKKIVLKKCSTVSYTISLYKHCVSEWMFYNKSTIIMTQAPTPVDECFGPVHSIATWLRLSYKQLVFHIYLIVLTFKK